MLKDWLGKFSLYKLFFICAGCFALLAVSAKVTGKYPDNVFITSIIWAIICVVGGAISLAVTLFKKHRDKKDNPEL